MVMKHLFRETLMSKFKALEVINALLGLYIVMVYVIYRYLGNLFDSLIYLTLIFGLLLIVYHVKMSSDMRRSLIGSGSLLNLRFASSTGFTFMLFFLAIAALVIGCVFSLPIAFVFALLFVLDHALYISIDKNQISPKNRKNESVPLLTVA